MFSGLKDPPPHFLFITRNLFFFFIDLKFTARADLLRCNLSTYSSNLVINCSIVLIGIWCRDTQEMAANTETSFRIKECYAVMKNAPLHGCVRTQSQINGVNLSESEKFHLTVEVKMLFDKSFLHICYHWRDNCRISDCRSQAIKFRQIQSIQKLRRAFPFFKTKKKRKEKSGDQH